MTPEGQRILEALQQVAAERERRAADPALGARVRATKAYQQRRFEKTYTQLLASPRYGDAARFFLEDLYGPSDFSERDAQFVRIVPALVRLFPAEIVGTVRMLAELHAMSEALDSRLAAALPDASVRAPHYVRAWQRAGSVPEREQQISLTLAIGRALDRYVRNPLLRHSLRVMRAPARAAGLGSLQAFLERGFDTFARMGGAREFLETVGTTERTLAADLFAARAPGEGAVVSEAAWEAIIARLP